MVRENQLVKDKVSAHNYAKIERDEYYYPLFLKYGIEHIKKAGFFFDSSTKPIDLQESTKLLCTPLSHISVPQSKKHCIIVTSGAMNVIHDGHIAMMVAAKLRLEKANYQVLGGYIAPDHDDYVKTKKNDYALPIHERNKFVTAKIAEHKSQDWLSLDPWYGVFTETSLNFTDLLTRTKLYIMQHLNIDTEICYVFGQDCNFCRTFEERGLCVVVSRANSDTDYEIYSNGTVLRAHGTSNLASSVIGQHAPQQDLVNCRVRVNVDRPQVPCSFYERHYKTVNYRIVHGQRVDLESQPNYSNIISLDAEIQAPYNLRMSRKFDIFGHSMLSYLVDTQQSNLPQNTDDVYTLYDDDIMTGGTIEFAKEYCASQKINIAGIYCTNVAQDKCEIIDEHDFLVFAAETSGLVIQFNDAHYRVPYVYPFVDPSVRCSCLNPMQFSLDVWQFNMQLHEHSEETLNEHSNSIYCKIGFDDSTTLYAVCKYYYYALKQLYDSQNYTG